MTRRMMLLVLYSGLLAGVVWAQKDKKEDPSVRSIEGTVVDDFDSPLEGAVVQLKNLKTLQVRSFITQKDGKYHFQGLSTNVDFEVRAQYKGKTSGAKILSTFDSRRRAIVNLKVELKK